MYTSSEQPPKGKEAQLLPPPKILIIDHNSAFKKVTEAEELKNKEFTQALRNIR